MASPVSAHWIPAVAPGAGNQLPCFTRYACKGSAGVDVFSQDVSRVPGESARAFGFRFPPTVLAHPAMQPDNDMPETCEVAAMLRYAQAVDSCGRDVSNG